MDGGIHASGFIQKNKEKVINFSCSDILMQEIINSLKKILIPAQEDEILIGGQTTLVKKENFQALLPLENKTLAFVDGGQAQLLSAPNFSLDFIKVFAAVFKNKDKIKTLQKQFYLLTKTNEHGEFSAEIFGDKIVGEKDLKFNSFDPTLKEGTQRASVGKVANIARRFAELAFCKELAKEVDLVILDGNLEVTTTNESKYLQLPTNVSALAKTTKIFTKKGQSAAALLHELSPKIEWFYLIGEENQRKIYFTKLNRQSEYVFHFEGSIEALKALVPYCQDAAFPGYPYGLIYADKFARVSNEERDFLKTNLMVKLGQDFHKFKKYLNALNAHGVLDRIG